MATAGTERQRSPNFQAAAWAGVFAGLMFLALEMVLEFLFLERSVLGPPRRMAALVLGPEVLPRTGTLDVGIMLVALVVHLVLSVLYAIALALLIRNTSRGMAILYGAFFGLALYLVNYHLFTILFPWFAEARNWTTVVSHAAFGMAAAWAYRTVRRPLPVLPRSARAFAPRWSGRDRRGFGHIDGDWNGSERRRA